MRQGSVSLNRFLVNRKSFAASAATPPHGEDDEKILEEHICHPASSVAQQKEASMQTESRVPRSKKRKRESLIAIASNLQAMASNLRDPKSNGLQPANDGLQPRSDGLQPKSDGLQPRSDTLQTKRDGLQPRSDALRPKSDSLQPRSDCLQPRSHGFQPKRDGLQSRGDALQPSSDALQPKSDRLQPRSESRYWPSCTSACHVAEPCAGATRASGSGQLWVPNPRVPCLVTSTFGAWCCFGI